MCYAFAIISYLFHLTSSSQYFEHTLPYCPCFIRKFVSPCSRKLLRLVGAPEKRDLKIPRGIYIHSLAYCPVLKAEVSQSHNRCRIYRYALQKTHVCAFWKLILSLVPALERFISCFALNRLRARRGSRHKCTYYNGSSSKQFFLYYRVCLHDVIFKELIV